MNNDSTITIGIIGAGRAGSALASAFHHAGYHIAALYSRRGDMIRPLAALLGAELVATPEEVARNAELVFIVTPDTAISTMCERIAASGAWRAGQGVVHCSGALGREPLAAATALGAFTGGFHPLQTLNGPESAARLRDAYIAIEADPPLTEKLHRLAEAVGARPFTLGAHQRPLYHAAAVMVANFTVTLYAAGVQLFSTAGLPEDVRGRALLPLLHGALESLEQAAPADALTGPYARGDALTVARHLEALAGQAPELLPLYREMGRATLQLARERGLSTEQIMALSALLTPPD